MRLPLSWLGEYTPLLPGSGPDDVHAALVAVGFEEEAVHRIELTGPIVVGQVLEFVEEPQSNGKTIRWCQVRVAPVGSLAADGGPDVRGIVCGAKNFFVSDKVIVTLPGSVLPGGFAIAARSTYGHVSDGMLASARELGISDDHEGIVRLTTMGLDPEVGTDVIDLLGLNDSAVEVNVTPDRGYAFSVRGLAREYAHATGQKFSDPAARVTVHEADGFPVHIDDAAPIRSRPGASGFVTRVVRGIDATRPSPPHLVSRLRLAGMRSISLPVDISNYVMLELGQPTHTYDLDRLVGGITVRRALSGEQLETLDGQVRLLHPEDLLITDDAGPIGIAGVMGGARTEITQTTRDVLIEAATFDPVTIARSARRHKLPSEAAKRFERGVDPAIAMVAAHRVAELLVAYAGGTLDTLGTTILAPISRTPISLPAGFAESVVGVAYPVARVAGALREIGAEVAEVSGGFEVVPPSWRPDLVDAWGLVEEVARIDGYDKIPARLPVAPPGRGLSGAQRLRRRVADVLAHAGLTEVVAYPFLDVETNRRFSHAPGAQINPIRLANPLDARADTLRMSLLPGLMGVAHRNRSRGLGDLAVFEQGTVFLPEPGRQYGTAEIPPGGQLPSAELLAELNGSLPAQPRYVAGLVMGLRTPKQPGQPALAASLVDALEAVDAIAAAVGVPITVRQGRHDALHPGRTAAIFVETERVGYAGELLPELAIAADLPRQVAVWELNLDQLIEHAETVVRARAISVYPAATQDLSLVVDITVPAGDLVAAVRDGAGPLLEAIDLVDDYRGSGLPEGSKSVTLALRFRANDRTLTAAEASAARTAGAELAQARFGARLRD